jgi:hypothetical protein
MKPFAALVLLSFLAVGCKPPPADEAAASDASPVHSGDAQAGSPRLEINPDYNP